MGVEWASRGLDSILMPAHMTCAAAAAAFLAMHMLDNALSYIHNIYPAFFALF